MRPRTITVDISRGGAWALRDYRRKAGIPPVLRDCIWLVETYSTEDVSWIWVANVGEVRLDREGRWHYTQEDTDGS